MRVLLVSDAVVERSRGPIRRLAGVLPHLAASAEVHLARLGPSDAQCERVFAEHCASVHPVRFEPDGWLVRNVDEIAREVDRLVATLRPDVVVLCWEIWSLISRLSQTVPARGVPFAVFLHSMPFVDAPPTPSRSYYLDLLRRWVREPDWNVRTFTLRCLPEIRRVLARTHVISINRTVDSYLERYFPALRAFGASPGYAVDAAEIDEAAAGPGRFDFAFMAKLERGKGVFELVDIFRRIVARRPGARLLAIGSFSDAATERRLAHQVAALGLAGRIELAGWVSGAHKYELLKQARVFLYPSISADTFSFCLLEALACGLPAVCYDVPFSRAIYGETGSVRRVGFRDNEAFAGAALALLDAAREGAVSEQARAFSAQYTSWARVAAAELAAYQAIVEAGPDARRAPAAPARTARRAAILVAAALAACGADPARAQATQQTSPPTSGAPTSQATTSQATEPRAAPPTPRIGVDRRVELMAILFKLAGNPEYNQGRLQPYNADIARHFGPFRDHAAVAAARDLRTRDGVGFDRVMALAINLGDPYALDERVALDAPAGLLGRAGLDAAERARRVADVRAFLAAARRFVADAGVRDFFAAHQALYDSAGARIRRPVEREAAFAWVGRFFGTPPDRDFAVVPLLANSGGNFGPCAATPRGTDECYQVLGHDRTDSAGFPVYGPSLVPTLVHELSHSYANPLGDARQAEFARSAPRVHALVVDAMRAQGYGDRWATMVNESLVRAAVARYLGAHADTSLLRGYLAEQRARGWLWMDELTALLGRYEADRRTYPTLDAFMPRVVAYFDTLPDRVPALVRRYDASRPKVLSLSVADGAAAVDPTLREIVVRFDRPVRDGPLSVGPLRDSSTVFPKITAQAVDTAGTTLRLTVELEPGRAYAFRLNTVLGDGLRTVDSDVPLALYPVRFATRPSRPAVPCPVGRGEGSREAAAVSPAGVRSGVGCPRRQTGASSSAWRSGVGHPGKRRP